MTRSTGYRLLVGTTLLFFALTGVTGCKTYFGTGDPVPVKSSPPTVYTGGPILTMEGNSPESVEALATEDGRIVATGKLYEVLAAIGPRPDWVDLQGATLLPGFIDSHLHFGVQAQLAAFDVVEPWRFEDADAFLAHIADLARDRPKGEWIITFGFDRVLVPPFRNLTRDDLDRATKDHPVLVLYLGLHWASANTRALEIAGIDRDTPTNIPGGGIFFKDEAGDPTGLLTESAVFTLIEHLPENGPPGSTDAHRAVAQQMSAAGITTFAERATGASGGLAELDLLYDLAHDPSFPQRIVATPLYQLLPELEGPTPWDGFYQARQVKLLIDASLVGGTSATLEPQVDGSRGALNYPHNEYRRALREAAAKGFATATHTMGDRGHRVMLDVFEELKSEVMDEARFGRHSIEHSALVHPDDIPRMARLGLSVSQLSPMLPVHGDALSEHLYGPERTSRVYDANAMLRAGINLALHSDAPVFAPRPLTYVSAATTRETTSGVVRGPDARISRFQALRGITLGAATHLSLEDELGSLTPGKRADLVILEKNPLEVDTKDIRGIRVLRTIMDGVVYFDRIGQP